MIKVALFAFLASVGVCHWVYLTILALVDYGVLLGILSFSVGIAVLAVVATKADERARK